MIDAIVNARLSGLQRVDMSDFDDEAMSIIGRQRYERIKSLHLSGRTEVISEIRRQLETENKNTQEPSAVFRSQKDLSAGDGLV